ncbi:hypothetical protein [Oleiagrimonas sp. C23AA]|uniref:hypothetical protein n=1 Tax=Oleiagrimonas sp. C23AA TaxID=2719047 RepID=UPI00141E73C1|nr:hypothetical protein [Oleiagrimonas sp. C23AA]NII12098.1 hypothetical protein [Oleiagrimonas sp. C23AA]
METRSAGVSIDRVSATYRHLMWGWLLFWLAFQTPDVMREFFGHPVATWAQGLLGISSLVGAIGSMVYATRVLKLKRQAKHDPIVAAAWADEYAVSLRRRSTIWGYLTTVTYLLVIQLADQIHAVRMVAMGWLHLGLLIATATPAIVFLVLDRVAAE